MRSRGQVFFVIAAFMLLTIAAPGTLLAADIQLIVNNATNAACSSPSCFTTIQAAIEYASPLFTDNTGTTYSILVEPGTYSEAITLASGVTTIKGRETARTILIGSGSSAAVTINNKSATVESIRNFSFKNTSAGIMVTGYPSNINITNNVFYNTSGTAVTIQNSPSTNVINNTFDLNGTAVVRDSTSNQITNNIFFNKKTANISQGALTVQDTITYNYFSPLVTGDIIGLNSFPNQTITGTDPLFVDITDASRLDFHLQTLSPCRGNGATGQCTNPVPPCTDIGAYGGPNTDTIPMQLFNVIAVPLTTTSISLAWNANLSYEVTGYRINYGTAPGVYDGTGAAEGASPINVSTITATTLSGLTTTVPTPANPLLNKPTALNESLILSWNAVPGATKYRVYYGTSSPPNTTVDVGNATTYKLSGLTNGQTYFVAVSAIAEPIYYIAITAFDSTGQTRTAAIIPGINHESAYSQEVSASFGSAAESGLSNIESDFPEALVAYPNLQNSHRGCFIATAAYGSYSAPEVQALRAFRDRYLLTNSAGSAFVRWYYEHGPVAAAYLEAHPGYKHMVRTALMPAVGLALFMTGTSMFIKAVVALLLLIIALMLANSFFRKRLSGSGGA
jgi:Periplasmic copper-binding protein (NosD)